MKERKPDFPNHRDLVFLLVLLESIIRIPPFLKRYEMDPATTECSTSIEGLFHLTTSIIAMY